MFEQQSFKTLDEAEAYLKQTLNLPQFQSPSLGIGVQVPVQGISPLSDQSPLFINAVRNVDIQLSTKNEFYPGNTSTGGSQTAPSLSPLAYANYLKLILKSLDTGRGAAFILSQAALHLLNPDFGKGQLYNPLTIAGPPPFFGGYFTDNLDHPLADSISIPEDKLTKLYNGQDIKTKFVPPGLQVDGPNTLLFDGKTFDQKTAQLNNFADNKTKQITANNFKEFDPYDNTNVVTSQNELGVDVIKPDYDALFTKTLAGPGFSGFDKGGPSFRPKFSELPDLGDEYIKAKRNMGLNDVYFSKGDLQKGYVVGVEGQDAENAHFRDENTYMPFYFQDLRKTGRLIYFRAFLTNFEESFAPSWNKEQFYGRVDPVGIYMNTTRTFSVGFKIASFSQAGFTTMWRKINNLTKLVYPQMKNGVFAASPTIRLRIGDVCADGAGRGIPGFIDGNLSFNYTDSTWETVPYFSTLAKELGRAPMIADCSFTFQVIHEQNPSVDENYNFDTTFFRRIGTLRQDIQSANNPNNEPDPNQQNQTSNSSNQTTVLTGSS